jgi:hypothetical protein
MDHPKWQDATRDAARIDPSVDQHDGSRRPVQEGRPGTIRRRRIGGVPKATPEHLDYAESAERAEAWPQAQALWQRAVATCPVEHPAYAEGVARCQRQIDMDVAIATSAVPKANVSLSVCSPKCRGGRDDFVVVTVALAAFGELTGFATTGVLVATAGSVVAEDDCCGGNSAAKSMTSAEGLRSRFGVSGSSAIILKASRILPSPSKLDTHDQLDAMVVYLEACR